MKTYGFKIFLMVVVLGCVGCGARLKTGDPIMSATVLAQVDGKLPQFQSLAVFPGGMVGYSQSSTQILQLGNEVCLEIFHFALLDQDGIVPVRVAIDMQPIASDDLDIRPLEDTTMYCYSPFIEEGHHAVDIDLLTPENGIESYTLEFFAPRQMGIRPMYLFPGEVSGFEVDLLDPIMLISDETCMTIFRRLLQDEADYRFALQVQIDGEDLEAGSIDTVSNSDSLTYCYALDDLASGFHDIEVQLRTIGSTVPTDNNSGLFDSDVVQVGEVYGWEFVVGESE